MRRSLVKLSSFVKAVTKNGDSVSKYDKSCRICSMILKGLLVKYDKYGTLFKTTKQVLPIKEFNKLFK